MKAAVLHEVNQPMTIGEVSLTRPKRWEVLVCTIFAGLRHGNPHFIEGPCTRTRCPPCRGMRRRARMSPISGRATM